MTTEKVLAEIKKKHYHPVYWLEGDEEYFIDQVMDYAEAHILTEEEKGFNQTIIYGRDAEWSAVMNACRRYPMFAERQVVLLKEAQDMRGIEKLDAYVEKPLASTILLVAYKGKKVDKRTRLAKLLKEKATLVTTKKLYDNELPGWTQNLVQSKGFTIANKALLLLIDHIGNDLGRLNNEIDKLALNLGERKNITEDDIEKYVGISKEFNVFELQNAIAQRNLYKALRIVQYFESNPKAGPLQLILPSLYNFFSKVQMAMSVASRDEKSVAAEIGVSSFFVKDYMQSAARYNAAGIEKILLLLHAYNLKSIGIGDAGTEDMSLLKEMIVKIMQP